MRITDHVYLLSGSYFGAVNDQGTLGDVYAVRTGQGLILIDCGVTESGLAQIRETLEYYGIEDPITHLIITHAHFDHCGSAKAIQDMGAQVIVGAEDAFQCTNGGSRGLRTPYSPTHVFPAFTPDVLVESDCEKQLNGLKIKFIKLPGHTPGCMAIQVGIDRKSILFSGDALQPGGAQLDEVGLGWPGDIGFDRAAIVDSMLKLMEYQTDMILPGHGKICLKNGTQLLRLAAETAFLTMR